MLYIIFCECSTDSLYAIVIHVYLDVANSECTFSRQVCKFEEHLDKFQEKMVTYIAHSVYKC